MQPGSWALCYNQAATHQPLRVQMHTGAHPYAPIIQRHITAYTHTADTSDIPRVPSYSVAHQKRSMQLTHTQAARTLLLKDQDMARTEPSHTVFTATYTLHKVLSVLVEALVFEEGVHVTLSPSKLGLTPALQRKHIVLPAVGSLARILRCL